MIAAQIIKIKNGAVTLPKQVRTSWKNASVYVSASKDSVLIKRFAAPRTSRTVFDTETVKKLRVLGKGISTKDIQSAVRSARVRK